MITTTMKPLRSLLVLIALATTITNGFVPINENHTKRSNSLVCANALWRHFIPDSDNIQQYHQTGLLEERQQQTSVVDTASIDHETKLKESIKVMKNARDLFLGSLLALAIAVPQAGVAVSGGGLDFANLDITGKDFSNNNYKGKDFTQVIAKGTTFANSNLQGCRFYKAYLVNTDFSGADLRGASLEDTSMDGASLKNAIAAGSYFSKSILDAGSVENADFTDAQIPLKTLPLLCEREDVTGVNPTTGVDTRESLLCP